MAQKYREEHSQDPSREKRAMEQKGLCHFGLDEIGLGGAGPRPSLGICGQAGGDGVGLYVGANAVELGGVADPVVERFVLPEMLAGAVENGVGVARGYAL